MDQLGFRQRDDEGRQQDPASETPTNHETPDGDVKHVSEEVTNDPYDDYLLSVWDWEGPNSRD
jgi:hypothetical protein